MFNKDSPPPQHWDWDDSPSIGSEMNPQWNDFPKPVYHWSWCYAYEKSILLWHNAVIWSPLPPQTRKDTYLKTLQPQKLKPPGTLYNCPYPRKPDSTSEKHLCISTESLPESVEKLKWTDKSSMFWQVISEGVKSEKWWHEDDWKQPDRKKGKPLCCGDPPLTPSYRRVKRNPTSPLPPGTEQALMGQLCMFLTPIQKLQARTGCARELQWQAAVCAGYTSVYDLE